MVTAGIYRLAEYRSLTSIKRILNVHLPALLGKPAVTPCATPTACCQKELSHTKTGQAHNTTESPKRRCEPQRADITAASDSPIDCIGHAGARSNPPSWGEAQGLSEHAVSGSAAPTSASRWGLCCLRAGAVRVTPSPASQGIFLLGQLFIHRRTRPTKHDLDGRPNNSGTRSLASVFFAMRGCHCWLVQHFS